MDPLAGNPGAETTTAGAAVAGVVAMPAREVHALRERVAELEAALRECIEWAGSDCEHPACKGVIETASRLVQLDQ